MTGNNTMASTGPTKIDLVKLLLEQSQKITKLESKIKKNEFENVAILGGTRELSVRQLLQSTDIESDGAIRHLEDKEDNVIAEGDTRETSNERENTVLKVPKHPPPTSGA